MNITKKRLNKIKKTKNQSKRYIHKNNKKKSKKKNKSQKLKRKAYNLKNKSFKLLKKRKRKYKGGAKQKYIKLWTPLVDIKGEVELWTPFDDIEFDDKEFEKQKDKINTYIIRGDDGTSKKDRQNEDVKEEQNQEETQEETQEGKEETQEEEGFSKGKENKGDANKKTTKKNDKKKSSIFSRFSKNKGKPVKYKPFDSKKHEPLIGALKDDDNFQDLIGAIKKEILGSEKELDEPIKNNFYFQIHNQLMNSELFETIAKNSEEDKVEKGLTHIANEFFKMKDENIKNIIKSIKDEKAAKVEEDDEEAAKVEEEVEEDKEDKEDDDEKKKSDTQINNQVGGGKVLLKWIKDLKKSLKNAELGAHLQKMVRLPKKELFLTLNFVEDKKEEEEENKKSRQDIQTNMKSISVGTEEMLNQLVIDLKGHIDEAENQLKIKKRGETAKVEAQEKEQKDEEQKVQEQNVEEQKDKDFDEIDETKD